MFNPFKNEIMNIIVRINIIEIETSTITVKILDKDKTPVKTVYNDMNRLPVLELSWDCKDEQDRTVSSGIYICGVTVTSGNYKQCDTILFKITGE